MKFRLERFGTIGTLAAAILCPICFPKLALIGAALGLGALAPFEGWFVAATHVFLVMAVIGHFVAFRQHQVPWIPALAAMGAAAVPVALWLVYVEPVVYLGLFAVVVATVGSVFALRETATGTPSIDDSKSER